MNFKKIYSAANIAEAYLIQGLLNNLSIESVLSGENLSIAAGGLPADVFQVDIMVPEKSFKEAAKVISNYEKSLKNSFNDNKSWICEKCNDVIPEIFEICWSCQA